MIFIFLVFESILTSDTSSLQPYISVLALRYCIFFGSQFFSQNLPCDPYVANYTILDSRPLENQHFVIVFHPSTFFFLMCRPTCVWISMIMSLVSLFATIRCFEIKKNEGPWSEYQWTQHINTYNYIPLSPASTLAAKTSVHTTNHFARTVFCLCTVKWFRSLH